MGIGPCGFNSHLRHKYLRRIPGKVKPLQQKNTPDCGLIFVYGGYSSMVEHLVVAQKAVGSSPTSHPRERNRKKVALFFLFQMLARCLHWLSRCHWGDLLQLLARQARRLIILTIFTQVYVHVVELPVGNCRKLNLNSWIARGNALYKVNIDDPVVINPQRIEQCILRYF